MSNVSIVLGSSGCGKSSSTRGLDPETTYFINCLGKHLPFKGSKQLYNKEKGNIVTTSDHAQICKILKAIPEKKPNVKTIIIDDMRYIMIDEFFKRAKETGFTKFTEMGQHFKQVIDAAKGIEEDINIVFMLHDDDKVSNQTIVEKKPKLVGKLVEEACDPLEIVTCVFYARLKFDGKSGDREYVFVTNRSVVNGCEVPAKSPDGMFEELETPNDLNLVFQKMDEYYN